MVKGAALTSYGIKYTRMDQAKFSKGCLPQNLLGPFLNTLSHMKHLVKPLYNIFFVRHWHFPAGNPFFEKKNCQLNFPKFKDANLKLLFQEILTGNQSNICIPTGNWFTILHLGPLLSKNLLSYRKFNQNG